MKINPGNQARWLIFALILAGGVVLSPIASGAAPKTYTDPQGFFSFTPPPGWVEKDYPGEKVGRVRFTAPDRQATMSIIAGPASPRETTLEQLLNTRRVIMAKMRREKPEGRYHLALGTICQFRCVKFDVEFPGQFAQENYLLMEQGLNISFGYTAANQAGLEKYRQTALDSFCTIKLTGKK